MDSTGKRARFVQRWSIRVGQRENPETLGSRDRCKSFYHGGLFHGLVGWATIPAWSATPTWPAWASGSLGPARSSFPSGFPLE